jgi:hypothetical protein
MTTTVPGLLAVALTLGLASGCSGDDSASDRPTTTIDQVAFEREQMCESLKAYTDQEDQGTPRLAPTQLDQAGPTTTAAPRVDPRLAPLERLEANLTADVPPSARDALAEMKALRSVPLDDSVPPDLQAPTVDVVLPPLFDYLDPICESVNGRDPSAAPTTTIGAGGVPTTAAGGASTTAPAAEPTSTTAS